MAGLCIGVLKTLTDETLNIISIKKDLGLMRDRLRDQEAGFQRELTVWQRRIESATDQLRCKLSVLEIEYAYLRHF